MNVPGARLTVLYPRHKRRKTTRFDWDYYQAEHVALIRERLGDALLGLSVERGVAGALPGDETPFLAIAHLDFVDMERLGTALDKHGAELADDVVNFTDAAPVVQLSAPIRITPPRRRRN